MIRSLPAKGSSISALFLFYAIMNSYAYGSRYPKNGGGFPYQAGHKRSY